MIYTKLTKRAFQIAYHAHHGQVDKSGRPYIHHPLHLAEQMPDEISTVVALLHDVIEDTAVTAEDLLHAGIPVQAVKTICHLTRNPEISYLDYIRALRNDPIAVRVKLADLAHNSDLSRLENISPKDLRRKEKYQIAMKILDE